MDLGLTITDEDSRNLAMGDLVMHVLTGEIGIVIEGSSKTREVKVRFSRADNFLFETNCNSCELRLPSVDEISAWKEARALPGILRAIERLARSIEEK